MEKEMNEACGNGSPKIDRVKFPRRAEDCKSLLLEQVIRITDTEQGYKEHKGK